MISSTKETIWVIWHNNLLLISQLYSLSLTHILITLTDHPHHSAFDNFNQSLKIQNIQQKWKPCICITCLKIQNMQQKWKPCVCITWKHKFKQYPHIQERTSIKSTPWYLLVPRDIINQKFQLQSFLPQTKPVSCNQTKSKVPQIPS